MEDPFLFRQDWGKCKVERGHLQQGPQASQLGSLPKPSLDEARRERGCQGSTPYSPPLWCAELEAVDAVVVAVPGDREAAWIGLQNTGELSK